MGLSENRFVLVGQRDFNVVWKGLPHLQIAQVQQIEDSPDFVVRLPRLAPQIADSFMEITDPERGELVIKPFIHEAIVA